MKRLSLWGFIFVALFGQVAFAKDQLKCSLIDSDDLLARENITLFTNDKKPGDPSFKIITIKLEEEELTGFTRPVETFSKCSTNNEDFVLEGKHFPQSVTECHKNGAIRARSRAGSEGSRFNARKLESARATIHEATGQWRITIGYAWLDYKVGSQELIGLSHADNGSGSYACY
jgi:hypothetical protein